MNDTEVIKKFYTALNGADTSGAVALVDPEIERMEFPDSPTPKNLRGLAAMSEHITDGRKTWAEGSCAPQEFFINGDKIVVDVHVHVRQNGKTEWIDAHVFDAFMMKNGKITQFHSFVKRAEAFAWAGLKN
ncbi:MAG: nuclear transport factor 2 family protein [Bdellovibrionaceae bacterium]|nr:nuclear transport factor 2 family protein [Pseudobdellovibrionaceae bacterium]